MNCLPHAGGLLDQNPTSIGRIDAIIRARNDWHRDDIANKESKEKAARKVGSAT